MPEVLDTGQQSAGLKPKAGVKFTLHVHLADGSIKDIECVGTIDPEPKEEVRNDDLGSR